MFPASTRHGTDVVFMWDSYVEIMQKNYVEMSSYSDMDVEKTRHSHIKFLRNFNMTVSLKYRVYWFDYGCLLGNNPECH